MLNQNLYCANIGDLNDPFEGLYLSVAEVGGPLAPHEPMVPFGFSTTVKIPKLVSKLPSFEGLRVCSLSASFEDVRLWSYYAGGHTGIAIEIEIDENEELLHKVDYVKELKEIQRVSENLEPIEILKTKTIHWDYEEEYRLITGAEVYSVSNGITGVFLGIRSSKLIRDALIKLIPDSIPIYSTILNTTTLQIEPNELMQ